MDEPPEESRRRSLADDVVSLFESRNLRVRRVHISGLGRTRSSFFDSSTFFEPLLRSESVEELMVSSGAVKDKLLSLGIFRDVQVTVDASQAPPARLDTEERKNVDVTFEVEENSWRGASAMLSTSAQEASAEAAVRFPNMLGGAESLTVGYSKSTNKSACYHADLSKPLGADFNSRATLTLLRQFEPNLISRYDVVNRGFTLDLSNLSGHFTNTLKYTGLWRQLSCPDLSAPLDVRLDSGHSIYSGISYILSFDSRGARKPGAGSPGLHAHSQVDVAGGRALGGDTHFVKWEGRLKKVVRLPLGAYLALSARAGHVFPLSEEKVSIMDKFFIGGPACVRGFATGGVGAQADGCSLGGTTFWTGGLSLFSRLPFRPSLGGFGDKFWLHGFVNAGNISNDTDLSPDTVIRRMASPVSWSAGLGLHFTVANLLRAELNYCWPRTARRGDRTAPGFQFGIGIDL